MATTKRVVGTVVLLAFVVALVLRPLLSTPGLFAAFRDGPLSPQTLLAVPLLLVTLLLAAARLRSLTTGSGGSDGPDHRSRTAAGGTNPAWGTTDRHLEASSGAGTDSETRASPGTAAGPPTRADPDAGAGAAPAAADRPDPLSGQGGTRRKDFEIETEPPDAALSAHLDHLRTELDDEAATDLETMADVVADAGTGTVPERCPQPHCNAAWTARTVFGVSNDKYEFLDDGARVRCLECEQVVTLT